MSAGIKKIDPKALYNAAVRHIPAGSDPDSIKYANFMRVSLSGGVCDEVAQGKPIPKDFRDIIGPALRELSAEPK